MRTIPAISIALVASMATTTGADGDGPRRVLVGRDLSRTEIVVEGLDASGVHTRDAKGSRRTIPHAEVLALHRVSRAAPSGTLPVVSLTDGQRIVGALGASEPGSDAGDSVRVDHPLLGTLSVPLDLVETVTNPGMPEPARGPGDDVVLLVNGDVLRGFVTRIGREVGMESPAGDTQAIPLESVASVRVQNPEVRATGPMVWLADGTVARIAMPVPPTDAGLVTLDPLLARTSGASEAEQEGGPPTTILDNVLGWMPDAARLVPLSRLSLASVTPVAPRPWTDEPELGDPDAGPLSAAEIRMPGPCVAVWTLPPDADGITCEVILPEAFRDWGDCEVVIGASTRGDGSEPIEVWRGRINGDAPTTNVAASFARGSTSLVVRVEPGELGPVQDRPTIASAFVRITPR